MVFVRRLRAERMDDPALDAEEHYAALAGLARIHRWSGTATLLAARLVARLTAPATRATRERKMRILDLASGGGDLAIALHRRLHAGLQRAGSELGLELGFELHGCDVSPRAVAFAREQAARSEAPVKFFEHDLLRDGVPPGFDIHVCSLFLHHLTRPATIDLLRGMATGHALLAYDLVRNRAGLLAAHLGTRVLTRSPIVRADGPLSVRNAFTVEEMRDLADAAGLEGATVSRHWPFRMLLEWSRADGWNRTDREG